jgi:hypothetical protein
MSAMCAATHPDSAAPSASPAWSTAPTRCTRPTSPAIGECYFFGGGTAAQVVKEQDKGHDPGAELHTGQN